MLRGFGKCRFLDKYQDYETNPAAEALSRTVFRLNQPETDFYLIHKNDLLVGAVRVVRLENSCRISPIFILPTYQNQGIAQSVLILLESMYQVDKWELSTILQECKLRYLYEKMGYHSVGENLSINDKMAIIFYEKHAVKLKSSSEESSVLDS